MAKTWRKKSGSIIWALVFALALTACSSGGKGQKEAGVDRLDREDAGSLKVAYFNEQAFYMQYGNAFQAMFPKVELEVVSTESVFSAQDPEAAMEKLIDEQHPDVLYLTEEQYSTLAKNGKLYDLDAVIKRDEFDINSFHPAVIDLLKAQGGGKLYGLSSNFSSQVLYYNKDLFTKYGVSYPQDGMSWEEVLQLAARFPAKKDGNDALFGLAPSSQAADPFELIRTIGEAKGLMYADSDAGTVSIDTPEWKEIFQTVTDGYKSGGVLMPSNDDGGGGSGPVMSVARVGGGKAIRFSPDSMRFMNGQAAMAIDGPMLMNMMGLHMMGGVSANVKGNGAPMKPPSADINWDVVTLPVDSSQPDVAGGMGLENIFSINASSENLAAAWEFVKYVNGEQLAKTGAKAAPSLSSRTAYKPEAEGKNIDAFYALGANQQSLLQTLPEGFAESFAQLASEQIKKIVDGMAAVDEVLKTIQSQGQDLLTQAKVQAEQQ